MFGFSKKDKDSDKRERESRRERKNESRNDHKSEKNKGSFLSKMYDDTKELGLGDKWPFA